MSLFYLAIVVFAFKAIGVTVFLGTFLFITVLFFSLPLVSRMYSSVNVMGLVIFFSFTLEVPYYLAGSKVSGNLGAISHLSPGHLAPRFPNTFESAKYTTHLYTPVLESKY